MNDPCGPGYLVTVHDSNNASKTVGVFHLFYQCNPTGPYWGDMHWCHATSSDTIYWTNQPIALGPGSGGPGGYPDPAPTEAPSQPPSFIGAYSDESSEYNAGTGAAAVPTAAPASLEITDSSAISDSGVPGRQGRGKERGRRRRRRLGEVPQFQSSSSYDDVGVFSGSLLFGGITNNSAINGNLGTYNDSTVATGTCECVCMCVCVYVCLCV